MIGYDLPQGISPQYIKEPQRGSTPNCIGVSEIMADSYRSLYYHVVFSTKHREPYLSVDKQDAIHQYMMGAIRQSAGEPIAVGGWIDHVHLLFSPNTPFALEEFVKELKRATNTWLRSKQYVDESFHWQRGYGAFTIARWDVDNVAKYIREQEEHHRVMTFAEEYRKLLVKHGVEFNERYFLD